MKIFVLLSFFAIAAGAAHLRAERRNHHVASPSRRAETTSTNNENEIVAKKERVLQGYSHHPLWDHPVWDHLQEYDVLEHDVDDGGSPVQHDSSARTETDETCRCPVPALKLQYPASECLGPSSCNLGNNEGLPNLIACRWTSVELSLDDGTTLGPGSFCDYEGTFSDLQAICSPGTDHCPPVIVVDNNPLTEHGKIEYSDEEETEVISVTDKSYLTTNHHTTSNSTTPDP